jgi:beta-glucosidase
MSKEILAFDPLTIHAGNKGLAIDHAAVQAQVEALLESMTLAQQVNEIRGLQAQPVDGLYYAGGDAVLDIPVFKMVDGPRGARAGKATAFPVGIARGATFDPELERRVGLAIGLEVAAKGGNVLLAPTINLLRHPGWGRAQETYSEDPFHMGAMAVAFISGAQNHVLTSPKHFAVNNVENTRFEMSSNLPPRVLHEVYLPHFKRCVIEAGAASVMSAYNKVNDVYCGEHQQLLTDILRDDWGFQGFVESDWFLGTRSTSEALNAGLDIEMPAGFRFADEKIYAAITAGTLTEATVRQAAGRALHAKLAWELATLPVPAATVVESAAHIALAREVAEKSIVLLKNSEQQSGQAVLPLNDKPGRRYAIVGDMAAMINLGDRGSSYVTSSEVTTLLDGITQLTKSADITYFGSAADLAGLAEYDAAIVVAGLTYIEEGEFIPTQQQEAEGEALARGGDREVLTLPNAQRDLILAVAGVAQQTIVVLEGGSAIQVRDWVDQVDGLLMAWYPGREGGHAIANILFGKVNPSGRLPVSFPTHLDQHVPWDITALQVPHEYLHGYGYMQAKGERPEFSFGSGLSYSRFDLTGMTTERHGDGCRVMADVVNISTVAGATIVQLYVSCQDSKLLRVPATLKGFGRVELAAGEAATLVMDLADSDLHYFDEDTNNWQLEACQYDFQVGFASDELLLANSWRFDGSDWDLV